MALSRWQQVVGGLVVAALAGTVVLVARPELAAALPTGSELVEAAATLDPTTVGVGAAVALGALLALLVAFTRSAATDDDRFDRLRERPPEAVTADEATRTGSGFDEDLDRAERGVERGIEATRDRLAELAARVHAAETGDPVPAAREAVTAGAWTDDRTAAAFLGGPELTYSVVARLRLWLDPETERRRRVAATVAAVRERADGGAP
ncbi:DUF7269 family protein [Halosegnis marinus]|uniref:DUF4129 domain-containing protein n=1 Tax=Halosegnis marinus TaxID=3034023 RepID=A0ABD5ZM85_9EURY|nr:hypothetical protein [Halosegnis sp. DT85]